MKTLLKNRKDFRSNPVNIMYVVDRLCVGGAERIVYNLAKGIDRNFYKPYVCCLEKLDVLGEELKRSGVDIFSLNSKKGIDFLLPLRLAKILKRLDIKIIHAHNSTAFKHSIIASKIARTPIVIQTRHGDELFCQKRWQRYLYRVLFRQANRIVCICESLKQKLIKKERIEKEKVVVIRNGIDIKRFSNVKVDTVRKRKEIDLEGGDFVIINVANIRPEKGQDILIRAFKNIVKVEKKAKLLIVGAESDSLLAEKLKDLTKYLGIEENVFFLGARKDIAELLAISDIFVLSSITEGMPVSVLEAMATGKPIVSTNVGGVSEIVEDDANGILVPSESPHQLANAIVSILEDKDRSLRLGKNNREFVKRSFSLEKMVTDYENLYRNLNLNRITKKKRLLIVGMIPPPVGGMAVYVKEMLDSDLKEKYNLIHFDTSKKTPENRPLIVGLGYQLFLILKLIWVLIIKRPHLVHIHICSYLSFFRSSIDFIIAKALFRKIIILHIHGAYFDNFYKKAGRVKKFLIERILKKTDRLIVLSSCWKYFLATIVNEDKISVVFNGITTSHYQSHYSKRRELSLSNNGKITLFFIGGLGERKGVYDILKTVSIIKETTENFICILAGGEEDPGVKEKIEALCKKEGIGARVCCIGPIYDEKKYNYFLKSDIFILPSYAENLPISVLEAMASGLPVVVSNVGAIPEIVQDEINGFVIKPGAYKKLAERIIFLMKNPDIRYGMGKRNYELANEKYDFTRVAKDLGKVYSTLI